jgi:hypothetical protein
MFKMNRIAAPALAGALSVSTLLPAIAARADSDTRRPAVYSGVRQNADAQRHDSDGVRPDERKGRITNSNNNWYGNTNGRYSNDKAGYSDNGRYSNDSSRYGNDGQYSNDNVRYTNGSARYSGNRDTVGYTQSPVQNQTNKNTMRNVGIASGAAAVLGALTHNTTVAVIGAAGAAYAGSQYEKDRKKQNDNSRYGYGNWQRR